MFLPSIGSMSLDAAAVIDGLISLLRDEEVEFNAGLRPILSNWLVFSVSSLSSRSECFFGGEER